MNQDNGGIIGKINTPTTSVASGVWSLQDQFESQSSSIWPLGFPQTTIANSCRFNDDSDDNLERAQDDGNKKTWTTSWWVKRANLGINTTMWDAGTSGGNNYSPFFFQGDDTIRFYEVVGGSLQSFNFITNRKFRDTSAWYHIVYRVDTTQSTSTDRVRIYINGVQETSFSTSAYPAQDYNTTKNNSSYRATIGTAADNDGSDLDAYLAEFVHVDGQSLEPTSFGAFNPVTNIWEPIAYAGTYGTNGFRLDFGDSSALGADVSGNSNNFTVNNLTSVDQSTDTCSNNFATLNPLHRGTHLSDATFSEGNLKHQGTSSGGNYPYSFSTIAASQGKWYAEFKVASDPSTTMIGIASGIADSFLGGTGSAKGYALYGNSGNLFESGSGSSYGSALSVGDILGVAMDLDNNKLYFSKNGTFQNSGDPTSGSTGTGAVSITAPADNGTGVYHFACGKAGTATTSIQANFGAPSFSISSGNADANGHGNFEYAVPSGYFALCTKNLAEFG